MKDSTNTNEKTTHDNLPQAVDRVYDEVSLMRSQLAELKERFEPKTPTEYLTRNELSKWLKCDLSTIHNWTKKGKLKSYGIGNRVYYKRKEVEEVLLPFGKNDEGSKP